MSTFEGKANAMALNPFTPFTHVGNSYDFPIKFAK